LRHQLEEQRILIEQQKQILDQLNKRLVQIEQSVTGNAPPSADQDQTPPPKNAKEASTFRTRTRATRSAT
jgi:hypothetical protein